MGLIPEVLENIYKNMNEFQDNTRQLWSVWRKYINTLAEVSPNITIDRSTDTVSIGSISPGCTLCKNGRWDCVFVTSLCNLECEFCISPFTRSAPAPFSSFGKDINETLVNYRRVKIKGISFSGGEPFMDFNRMVALLKDFKKALPDNYFWVYTNGLLVTRQAIDILVEEGLDEIRFNTAATGYNRSDIMRKIEYSASKLPRVSVEIPLILKDENVLLNTIVDYANAGVKFLNLHELMKEDNTLSSQLKDENFKSFVLEDGHRTEISLDSKNLIIKVIKKILTSRLKINLNFCSLINKIRQVRKRRKNFLTLLKGSHEKIVDEEYTKTILVYKSPEEYQFLHPDDWELKKNHYKGYQAVSLKKLGPLSVFRPDGRVVSAEKLT